MQNQSSVGYKAVTDQIYSHHSRLTAILAFFLKLARQCSPNYPAGRLARHSSIGNRGVSRFQNQGLMVGIYIGLVTPPVGLQTQNIMEPT